jgi:hypothetical protein
MSDIGTFLRLFEVDDATVAVLREHEDEVDAAYSHWIERGIDKVLRLTTSHGDEYVTCASRIERFTVSTPEGRRKAIQLEAAGVEEDAANYRAAGLPYESDGDEWRRD